MRGFFKCGDSIHVVIVVVISIIIVVAIITSESIIGKLLVRKTVMYEMLQPKAVINYKLKTSSIKSPIIFFSDDFPL